MLQLADKNYFGESIKVKAQENALIEIKNYPRVSFYKIPWNTFYGSLKFEKGKVKNTKTGIFSSQYIVVNTLPFQKYLKGIVETNDSEQ